MATGTKVLAYGSKKCSTPRKWVEEEHAQLEGADGIRAGFSQQ